MIFSNEVVMISVDLIKPNPYQPRKVFKNDELEELADSIKSVGLIQPITVRKIESFYEIVVGERRFRASKMAELVEIPAIVVDIDDDESAIIALIENLQRQDLNFIEEAEAMVLLMEKHGLSQKELAAKVGKKQSTISNKLRVLNLPDQIKDFLVTHSLSERHGRALLKLKEPSDMVKVIKAIVKKSLSVKATEELIELILAKKVKTKDLSKQTLKYNINYKIYINTVKQAYDAIVKTGNKALYTEKDKGDFIEIQIKIPKDKI